MVKIAAVKYVNTLPFLRGLKQVQDMLVTELILEDPANCARMLLSGDVDIALCPVGALIDLDTYELITDYCIGCDGAVRTVAVYSEVPVHDLKFIALYSESKTSNLLVQVMEREFWHYGVEFGYEAPEAISPRHVGYLCIGDRCFEMEKQYSHVCDLGEAWKRHTGLPFVFAAWASLKPVEPALKNMLNEAFTHGIRDIARASIPVTMDSIDPREYLTQYISYPLDAAKRKALQTFIHLAGQPSAIRTHATQNTS